MFLQLLKKQTQQKGGAAAKEEPLLSLEDLAKAYSSILEEQDMERKQRCMYKILKCVHLRYFIGTSHTAARYRQLMRLWDVDLDLRPDAVKLSIDGKHATLV